MALDQEFAFLGAQFDEQQTLPMQSVLNTKTTPTSFQIMKVENNPEETTAFAKAQF